MSREFPAILSLKAAQRISSSSSFSALPFEVAVRNALAFEIFTAPVPSLEDLTVENFEDVFSPFFLSHYDQWSDHTCLLFHDAMSTLRVISTTTPLTVPAPLTPRRESSLWASWSFPSTKATEQYETPPDGSDLELFLETLQEPAPGEFAEGIFSTSIGDRSFDASPLHRFQHLFTACLFHLRGIPSLGADPGFGGIDCITSGQMINVKGHYVWRPLDPTYGLQRHSVSGNFLAKAVRHLQNTIGVNSNDPPSPRDYMLRVERAGTVVAALNALKSDSHISDSQPDADSTRGLLKAYDALIALYSGEAVSISFHLSSKEDMAAGRTFKKALQATRTAPVPMLLFSLDDEFTISELDAAKSLLVRFSRNPTSLDFKKLSGLFASLFDVYEAPLEAPGGNEWLDGVPNISRTNYDGLGCFWDALSWDGPEFDRDVVDAFLLTSLNGATEATFSDPLQQQHFEHLMKHWTPLMLYDFLSVPLKVFYALSVAHMKEERRMQRISYRKKWARALSLGSKAVHYFPDDNHRAALVAWGRASWTAKDPIDGSTAPSGHLGWAHGLARMVHVNLSNEYLTTSRHDHCGREMSPTVLLTSRLEGGDSVPRELLGHQEFMCDVPGCARANKLTDKARRGGLCVPTLLCTTTDEPVEGAVVAQSRTAKQKQALKALPGHDHPTTGARLLLHGLRKCDHCRTPFLHRDINAATSILHGFFAFAALGRLRYGMYKGNVTKGRQAKGRGQPPKV